jgi:hypothetical protein
MVEFREVILFSLLEITKKFTKPYEFKFFIFYQLDFEGVSDKWCSLFVFFFFSPIKKEK